MNSNDDSRTNKNPGKKIFFSSSSSSSESESESESPHNSEYSSKNFYGPNGFLTKETNASSNPSSLNGSKISNERFKIGNEVQKEFSSFLSDIQNDNNEESLDDSSIMFWVENLQTKDIKSEFGEKEEIEMLGKKRKSKHPDFDSDS